MPEKRISTVAIDFNRIVSISILLILILSSLQGISGTALASFGIDRVERVDSSDLNEKLQEDEHLRRWTQSSTVDFEAAEDMTNLNTENNELKLETYTDWVGQMGSVDDPRGTGIPDDMTTTTITDDDSYQADRGGRIDKFSIRVGNTANEFELRVLKPTDNPDEYWVNEPEGVSDSLEPEAEETNDFDVDVPINKGDHIGIYTYGHLDARAERGGKTSYGYNGQIGSTPRTLEPLQSGEYHTMRAEMITHEEEGVLVSSIRDCGEHLKEWGSISWDADYYEDTDLTIETRTSPDRSTWSEWEEAENDGPVPSPVNRYIQYRATFQSFEGSYTPVLNSITIEYMEDKVGPDIYLDRLPAYQAYGPYEVTATILDENSGVNEDEVTLNYRKEDEGYVPFESVPMNLTDVENKYRAEIPDPGYSSGSEIQYYIRAEDQLGNDRTEPPDAEDEDNYRSFIVDKTPPETEVELDGDIGEDDWYTTDVEIIFDTEDHGLSDVDTWYQINGEGWNRYEPPLEITESGEYEFEFNSTDMAGNKEDTQEISFKIDNDHYMTDYNIEPLGETGDGGWYLDDVMVELETYPQASGIDHTRYRIDGGYWNEYTEPIYFDESGIYDLEFYSADGAGNEEDIRNVEIKVDKEDPEIEHEVDGTSGESGWYTSNVDVRLTTPEQISDIDSIYYRLNDGDWSEYDEPIELESGIYELEYYAENRAGRTSSEEEVDIKVDTELPELTVNVPEPEGDWHTQSPDITVSAEDEMSGLEVVKLRCGPDLEDDPDEEDWEYLLENTGTDEIQHDFDTIIRCEERGDLQLEVRAIDAAGNEVVAETEEGEFLPLKIDDSTPTLRAEEIEDTVWNNEMEIRMDIGDTYSGIRDVTLHYDPGDGWRELSMTRDGGEYVATIPSGDIGFSSSLEYYVVVEDNAGNEMESERKEADIGVNWWYFSPIPVVIVLGALFFYWKKNREEQEELIPLRESKLSKIKKGKEQKLDELEEEKEESTAIGFIAEGEGERCDLCGGPIDPENLLTCSCGNVYHDDCLRIEGDCLDCGEDYASVAAYSEESLEEKERPSLPSTEEEESPPPPSPEESDSELVEETEEKSPPPPPEKAADGSEEDKESVEVWADETSEENREEVQEKVKKAEQEVTEEKEDKIECPTCGNKNDADSDECWACGEDLNEDDGEKETDDEQEDQI